MQFSQTNMITISSEQFNQIKENMLKNRESFDHEIYNLIQGKQKIDSIKLPMVKCSDRHIFHTFAYDIIYSIDKPVNGCRDMIIDLDTEYINKINKKYYSPIIVQAEPVVCPIEPVVNKELIIKNKIAQLVLIINELRVIIEN